LNLTPKKYVKCQNISAEWGAQRIKGLSITKTILHLLKRMLPQKQDIRQKDIETSLIEQFLYPKHGPGQMWETVADKIREKGGEIKTEWRVIKLHTEKNRITSVTAQHTKTGETKNWQANLVFSTMAIKDFVEELDSDVPENVRNIANGLMYRDFITVGLLLKDLKIRNKDGSPITDNWIYIQEPDVKVGRLQVFNNWSPYMVKNPGTVWIGLEYFCNEGDTLWSLSDKALEELAGEELDKIGIIRKTDILDKVVIRMPKTYPAYFGAYQHFEVVRQFLDQFENLYPIGRNGMHRYNNQDHSMLTAMTAVDNILSGETDKENIWAVNTEQEYHEEK